MTRVALSRLYLACGTFGGEFVLMVALPSFGRRFGPDQVALLGVALAAANGGKLLGCLKIDAAITNAEPAGIGVTHALAVVAVGLCAAVLGAAYLIADFAVPVTGGGPTLGWSLVAGFAGGAVLQASTMRLLREGRLLAFAQLKALPSLCLVGLAASVGQPLLVDFRLAYLVVGLVAAVLHLRWPGGGLMRLRVAMWRELRAVRQYVLHGAPASALDAANLFMTSVTIVSIAGLPLAGQATQLQRFALAPSLATGMLLGQHVWSARFSGEDRAAARRSYRATARWATVAGLASVVVAAVLISGTTGGWPVGIDRRDAAGVAACLGPLLAQYIGSPLTVYFFKTNRMLLYGYLQVALLAALGLAWLVAGRESVGPAARTEVLFVLAVVVVTLTGLASYRAVSAREDGG